MHFKTHMLHNVQFMKLQRKAGVVCFQFSDLSHFEK